MKGILFTEFIEFAASAHGVDVLGARPRPSGAVGYAIEEFVTLVDRLAAAVGQSPDVLLRAFGERLFSRFIALYPVFFVETPPSALEFLAGIDTQVHDEVRKLYPDADFPRFAVRRDGRERLELTYRSERPLAALAEGLIRGCVAHFGEDVDVCAERAEGPPGCAARFAVTRRPAHR